MDSTLGNAQLNVPVHSDYKVAKWAYFFLHSKATESTCRGSKTSYFFCFRVTVIIKLFIPNQLLCGINLYRDIGRSLSNKPFSHRRKRMSFSNIPVSPWLTTLSWNGGDVEY